MENEYKGRLGCFGRLEERHKSRLSNILALISNLPFAAIPCYWWETDQVRKENGLVWGMQILTGTHHTRKNNSFKTPWISKNKGNKSRQFSHSCVSVCNEALGMLQGMQTHTQMEKPPAFVPETLSALNGNLAVTAETAWQRVVMEICPEDQWAGEQVTVLCTDTE